MDRAETEPEERSHARGGEQVVNRVRHIYTVEEEEAGEGKKNQHGGNERKHGK